jgi:hypothetical protein
MAGITQVNRSRLPLVELRHLICRIVQMVCEKYGDLNGSPFGSASIRTNPVGDQKIVNTSVGELTVFFFLADRASLC